MNAFEQYRHKYAVLIFTEYGEKVKEEGARLLEDILPEALRNESIIIVSEGGFSKAEGIDIGQILVIIHREIEPIDQLKDLMIQLKGKIVLTAIHRGTDEGIKQKQRELVQEVKGVVKDIHELDEDISPEWFSFSRICLAAEEGNTEELKRYYVKLVKTFLITIFFIFKHRIAHLFLPMDIDLMGICEVLKDDFKPPHSKGKEEWAKEYYREAFNGTSPKDRFKNLCDRARNEIEKAELDDDKKEAILQMFNCDNINLDLPDDFDVNKFREWAKNPEQNSFHQWFCKVMEELEKMKEEYLTEERK